MTEIMVAGQARQIHQNIDRLVELRNSAQQFLLIDGTQCLSKPSGQRIEGLSFYSVDGGLQRGAFGSQFVFRQLAK